MGFGETIFAYAVAFLVIGNGFALIFGGPAMAGRFNRWAGRSALRFTRWAVGGPLVWVGQLIRGGGRRPRRHHR